MSKRKEREKAMKLLGIAVILFVGLLAVAATNVSGRSEDRDAAERMTPAVPAVTPPPAPVETWTRYPVPLDDDLQRYIYDRCEDYGVDMPLVLAVISRESDYQADKLGDNGESYGLMQIHLEDHRDRCIRLEAYNLFDPLSNVRVGIDFLAELLAEGKGETWAVMAYNAGQGKADEWAARGYVSQYTEDVLDRRYWLRLDGEEVVR